MKKKIKIAEVITRLDWGGSPDIVRILCQHLDPEDFDVTLITGSSQLMSQKTSDFLEAFKGTLIQIPDLQRDIDIVKDWKAFWQILGIFRRERFDVVHTHTAKAGALTRCAAHYAGVKSIIHTPHGHTFYGYFGPWMSRVIVFIERFLARWTDILIVLTDLEKHDTIQYRVASVDRIRLIHQGVELDNFLRSQSESAEAFRTSLGVGVEHKIVGMIARLEPVKGPDIFIAAARIIAERVPSAFFVVVGEGSLRERLMERAREFGLVKKILFTGWREDVAQIIQGFEILVLPSRNEAAGMILIEAQASGIPVVATHVGGIPEIVCDGQTGVLVPPENPQAMALAIEELLLDESRRAAMSQKARRWVITRFGAVRMAEETIALYKEMYGISQRKQARSG